MNRAFWLCYNAIYIVIIKSGPHTEHVSHARLLFSRRTLYGVCPLTRGIYQKTDSLLGRINRRSENIRGHARRSPTTAMMTERLARDRGPERRNNARCEQLYATNACRCDIRTTTRWRRRKRCAPLRLGYARIADEREKGDKRRYWLGASILSIEITFWDAASKSNFHYSAVVVYTTLIPWERCLLVPFTYFIDRRSTTRFLCMEKCWIQLLIRREDIGVMDVAWLAHIHLPHEIVAILWILIFFFV